MNEEKLIRYILNEASKEETKDVLDWIYASPDNRTHYLELKSLWDAHLINKSYPVNTKVETAYKETWQRIERKKQVKGKSRRLHLLRIANIAALIALIGYSVYFTLSFLTDKPAQLTTIEAPLNHKTNITLPDGSLVWLNSNSKLTYADFSNTERRVVMLDGEARFDIQRDENKPFLVKTLTHEIEVLGTNFNVFAYEKSDIFEVALIEGSIRLSDADALHTPQQMEANQVYLYNKESQEYELKSNENLDFLWTTGLFYFDDAKLSDIFNKIAQYKGVEIIFNNQQIKNKRYTGKFKDSDHIEHILHVIAADNTFTYKINNNQIYIN